MLKKVSAFILLFTLLLFLGFFLFLKNGIKLDNLSLSNINITQLYLKLDKKLIFTVKTLEIIPSKDEESSSSDFDPSIILTANDLLDYVGLVRIDDLNVNGEHLFIELKEKKLFVKHKKGEASLDINVLNNDLVLKLNANSYEYGSALNASVVAKIDTLSTKLYKPIISLDADAFHKDIKVSIKANLKDAKLKYTIRSNEIKSLEFINDFTKLEPSVQKLIDNFKFSSIKIQEVNGLQDLEKISQFDIKSINAKVKIEDIEFKYENYPNIFQKEVLATLKDGDIKVNILENKKEKSISLSGRVISSLDGKDVSVDTNIYYKDIDIKANISVKDEALNYKLSSNKFKDIKDFEDFITIPAGIRTWAIDRLSSKAAKIENISGKMYLNPFDINLSSLRVQAKLYDILMDFNPKVAYPLNADIVHVNYDGKDMNIKLDAPRSNDVDLTGSDAVIYNMLGSNNGLLLRLQSISPLNWTLVRVVQSYGVSIPNDLGLRQTKGSSDIKVKIDIPFSNNPVDVYVKILNTDSTMKIKDNLVDFKTFDFLYNDKKVILKDTHAKYENYNAYINDMLFDISKSSLDLNLDAYDNNNTFLINLENKTNLEKSNTDGTINVKYVDMKDMVSMKNEKIPYSATFKEDIYASLPSLDINYKQIQGNHYLKANSLESLKKYIIPMQKAGVQKATINLESYGLDNIDARVYTKGFMDANKTYELDFNANVNLDTNISRGFLRFYDLKYDNKVNLSGTDIPYEVAFGKDINLKLPTLKVEYKNKDGLNKIDIQSIKTLTSLVDMLDEYTIPEGDIYVQSKNFKDINASVNLDISNLTVFYNNEKQDKISIDTQIKEQKYISVSDKKGMLKADIALEEKPKVDVKISGLGVSYKDESPQTTSSSKDTNTTTKCEYIDLDLPIINIQMKDGYFSYNTNRVNYNDINLSTNMDKIDLNFKDKNTSIDANIDGYKIDVEAKEITKEFINSAAGFKVIDEGFVNFNINGTQCVLDGAVKLDGVNIKDASILSNIFLTINSTPALLNPYLILPNIYDFATDGFSLSEYKIREGNLDFNFDRNTNILNITDLKTIGVYNSFYGKAMVDLNKSTLDASLEVGFMRGLANVISYIPVVGYWMLGEDERISYSVSAYGDLMDPTIETHFFKETTLAPVNIIKRVVTYPAKLVEYATSEDDNSTLSE